MCIENYYHRLQISRFFFSYNPGWTSGLTFGLSQLLRWEVYYDYLNLVSNHLAMSSWIGVHLRNVFWIGGSSRGGGEAKLSSKLRSREVAECNSCPTQGGALPPKIYKFCTLDHPFSFYFKFIFVLISPVKYRTQNAKKKCLRKFQPQPTWRTSDSEVLHCFL